MTKQQTLLMLESARDLLAASYIPWSLDNGRGGHCQAGCLSLVVRKAVPESSSYWVSFNSAYLLLEVAARRLHPEAAGASAHRPGGGLDYFDFSPPIYVNNHMGKDSILEVYDVAIADLAVEVLCEEESAKTPELEEVPCLC